MKTTSSSFGLALLVLAISCIVNQGAQAQTEASDQAVNTPALRPVKLYCGLRQPCIMEIDPALPRTGMTIVLMDRHGEKVFGPMSVRHQRIDVAAMFPRLYELARTGYLQLLVKNQPVGSAVVVQPMLTRMVPVTEEISDPIQGTSYTRIIGWRSEIIEETPDEEADPALDTGADTVEDGAASDENEEDAVPISPMFDFKNRLSSGVRTYVEHDVRLTTSLGTMTIAMAHDEAPNTAWNFLHLCDGGFYDNVTFHRIIPLDRMARPFVLQAGDPSATGECGPGYWLPLEPSELLHDFGVLSMARATDPDSAGSQFFICLSRAGTERLDTQYCPFGFVIDGADVIQAIANVELEDVAMGIAVEPPVIEEAKLIAAPARRPGEGRPDQPVYATSGDGSEE